MIRITTGQRWASRHDPSIIVTIFGQDPSGLWNCRAPTDRVPELISDERMRSQYRFVDDDDTAMSIAVHEARRGSPRRRSETSAPTRT